MIHYSERLFILLNAVAKGMLESESYYIRKDMGLSQEVLAHPRQSNPSDKEPSGEVAMDRRMDIRSELVFPSETELARRKDGRAGGQSEAVAAHEPIGDAAVSGPEWWYDMIEWDGKKCGGCGSKYSHDIPFCPDCSKRSGVGMDDVCRPKREYLREMYRVLGGREK